MHARRVCEISYYQRFFLNTVCFPVSLTSLVAVAWKLSDRAERTGSLDGARHDDRDSTGTSDRQLHVRGVGGEYEREGVLEATLSRFGHVIHATIRHRVDEAGNNTSWALVTMGTTDEANKVLGAVDSLPPPLTVQPFSKEQADKSTGGSQNVRQASLAKDLEAARASKRSDYYFALFLTYAP